MTTEKYLLIMNTIEASTTAARMAKIAERILELMEIGECRSDEHRYFMNCMGMTMTRKGINHDDYVSCLQTIKRRKLWNIVNMAETLDEIETARVKINDMYIEDIDLYDELMMALAYKMREAYHGR